jgi:polysaccharide deacetylase family sporulation protein PdaB
VKGFSAEGKVGSAWRTGIKAIRTGMKHLSKRRDLIGIVILLAVACVLFQEEIGGLLPASTTVGNRELPIYCVNTEEKKVALSFDAAWGNEDTVRILEILAAHDLHVTFFMTGGWVETYPEDVKAIAAAGHDIGNHSENHKEMSKLTPSEIQEELIQVHNKVKELTGQDMFLFRPPYGDYDNDLITTAMALNYYVIQWSVDSLDWKDYGVESIVKTVVNHKNLANGSIVLMHNGAKYTADALESVITGLENQGYEIVPISELIYTGEFHMDHTGKQFQN